MERTSSVNGSDGTKILRKAWGHIASRDMGRPSATNLHPLSWYELCATNKVIAKTLDLHDTFTDWVLRWLDAR